MRRMLTVVVLLGLAAVGCGGDDDDATSDTTDGGAQTTVAGAEDGAAYDGDEEATGGGRAPVVRTVAQLAEGQRELIRTAEIELAADDVRGTADRAAQVVRASGGDVFSQDARLRGTPKVTVVFKVPPERFDGVLDDLGELGEVTFEAVGTDDVTEQVVDMEARLANTRSAVERLRGLFLEAPDVNQIVAIEQALTPREAEMESLEAQLRSVRSQVDRATVTLTVVTPAQATETEPEDDDPGFFAGLSTGWDGLVGAAKVGAAIVGFALPFLALAAVLAVPVTLVRRRWRTTTAPADA